MEKIRKCVAIEHRQKGVQGLGQHRLQLAHRENGAGIGFGVKALDQLEVGFRTSHHTAELNIAGITCECHAAGPACSNADKTLFVQCLDDANQMMRRYAIGPADFLCGHYAAGGLAPQIEKNAKRVVGM